MPELLIDTSKDLTPVADVMDADAVDTDALDVGAVGADAVDTEVDDATYLSEGSAAVYPIPSGIWPS